MKKLLKFVLVLSIASACLASFAQAADQQKSTDYMPSLITKTPLEGRLLAITIVRKTIGAIQQDPAIKQAVRSDYQDDPELLMQAAELVAIEFKTIAVANNYWR